MISAKGGYRIGNPLDTHSGTGDIMLELIFALLLAPVMLGLLLATDRFESLLARKDPALRIPDLAESTGDWRLTKTARPS